METTKILSHVDHTILGVDSTWEQVEQVCREGLKYHTASVCIPPCYVGQAVQLLSGRLPVCTVIGFPSGYQSTPVKCFETKQAVRDGADEIDMVINVGWMKAGLVEEVEQEIRAVRDACAGKILKVIIETCLLNDEEKINLCQMASRAGADYIKTSTGFSKSGATREDVALFAAHIPENSPLKIKAAGGIRTLQDACDFLELGADRLGTSAIVKIVKEMQEHQ